MYTMSVNLEINLSYHVIILGVVATYIHVPPPSSAHNALTHNTTFG